MLLVSQKWFVDDCGFEGPNDNPIPCGINTAIFLVSNMQYLTANVVISITKYFKKPIYTNLIMMAFISLVYGYNIYSILRRDSFNKSVLNVS